jgi:hypothetical protein
MMYRRPAAQPEAVAGSWFGLGTATPPGRPVAQLGEPAQASGRVSYGFSAGPISPNREVATPLTPGEDDRRTDEFAAIRPEVAEDGLRPAASRRDVLVQEPPRRSRLFISAVVGLSAIVLLGGSIMGMAYFAGSNHTTADAAIQPGSASGGTAVTAPRGDRTKAAIELPAGAVHVTIRDLGDDLYRISTPDTGTQPTAQVRDDDVKLRVADDGARTGGEIDVVLAAKVHWSLRFSGAGTGAGTGKATVTLARASGTVPVTVNGAVDELVLRSPSGSPVRVRVSGGAKSVVAGSRTLEDLAAGSTLTPKNWATANRYDVAVGARITSLTVENA